MDDFINELTYRTLMRMFPSYYTDIDEDFYLEVREDVKAAASDDPTSDDISLAIQRVILRNMGMEV